MNEKVIKRAKIFNSADIDVIKTLNDFLLEVDVISVEVLPCGPERNNNLVVVYWHEHY
jgi:hypothetical protein